MLEHEKLTSSVVFSDLDWRNVAIHLLCRKILSVVPRPSGHTVVQNQTRKRQRTFRVSPMKHTIILLKNSINM